ncbi:hypothetical protein C5167_051122 [Papaver somniferum]|uniref:Acyl-coenzyme A thioesterase 13 n=1 Tax=Papaver somniferum TaxID=3469 RepID=A0A4Y7KS44_PAPSO|nr:uncharacterized protein LOC113306829 [Papaver somniferum]RZC75637.1 hypothetical protein C5167_051122 [Papaver somniferum]
MTRNDDDDEVNTIPIQIAKEWLESTARGQTGREIDRQALQNLYSLHVQKGLIQCNFVVPKSLSDRDGNWRVGAIASLIDLIGASVVHTIHGNIHVSVDFNISFFSTIKVQEEVEIEAKVLGDKGSLFSFTVVIRKKENGDLVAVGKQWMSLYDLNHRSKL